MEELQHRNHPVAMAKGSVNSIIKRPSSAVVRGAKNKAIKFPKKDSEIAIKHNINQGFKT
jgi:hypothetical protein